LGPNNWIWLFGSHELTQMHPNLAIIAQNCWGASPKDGISREGITIFLEKILAKTPNPKLLQSVPGKLMIDMTFLVPLITRLGIVSQRLSWELLRNRQSSCCWVISRALTKSSELLCSFVLMRLRAIVGKPIKPRQSPRGRVEVVSGTRISIIRGRTRGLELTGLSPALRRSLLSLLSMSAGTKNERCQWSCSVMKQEWILVLPLMHEAHHLGCEHLRTLNKNLSW
jgi:hypothetical protein